MELQRYLHRQTADRVVESLTRMQNLSRSDSTAYALELLAEAIAERTSAFDSVGLVTTAPDAPGVENRDTSVVVSELFRNAQRSVLLAGYAVHQGQKVFNALAKRMTDIPSLSVRFCLDIQRKPGDTTCDADLVRRFTYQFEQAQWPAGVRLPEIYYFPASLCQDRTTRAAMHAKCVVVDCQSSFVGSANFTEAAQLRNVEVGALIKSAEVADRLTRFFELLIEKKTLVRTP